MHSSGTAGLGAGTVSNLAQHHPEHIHFTGRNSSKAKDLIDKIHKSNPDVKLTYIPCDLTDFASVKKAANDFLSSSQRLDVLMLNAGIMATDPAKTKDNYEIQFQTNHLSHALLIKTLLPIMTQTASQPNSDVRIINMSSIAYQQAPKMGIDFATLKTDQSSLGSLIPGPKWSRYGQSKLANLLYPAQLAERHPEILSLAVHPGIILTDLFTNVSFATKLPVLISSIGKRTPVEQGPYNQLWAATAPREKILNGEYYEPIGVVGVRTTRQARDKELGRKLWDWTQDALSAV